MHYKKLLKIYCLSSCATSQAKILFFPLLVSHSNLRLSSLPHTPTCVGGGGLDQSHQILCSTIICKTSIVFHGRQGIVSLFSFLFFLFFFTPRKPKKINQINFLFFNKKTQLIFQVQPHKSLGILIAVYP